MKKLAPTIAIVCLLSSNAVFAYQAAEQRESSRETQRLHVVATAHTPERNKSKDSSAVNKEAAKNEASSNTQPDPALMPYVNGGYYDSK